MVKQESVENKMTMSEIARKGGQSTFKKYGREHFRKINAKSQKRRAELMARGRQMEQDGSKPAG